MAVSISGAVHSRRILTSTSFLTMSAITAAATTPLPTGRASEQIDSAAVRADRVVEIAVVERIDRIGVPRVCRPSGAIDHDS